MMNSLFELTTGVDGAPHLLTSLTPPNLNRPNLPILRVVVEVHKAVTDTSTTWTFKTLACYEGYDRLRAVVSRQEFEALVAAHSQDLATEEAKAASYKTVWLDHYVMDERFELEGRPSGVDYPWQRAQQHAHHMIEKFQHIVGCGVFTLPATI